MMESPKSKICGKTPKTKTMEIIVPLPRQVPIAAITGFVVRTEISTPATASIVPEVKIVGNETFKVSIIASFLSNVCLSSV